MLPNLFYFVQIFKIRDDRPRIKHLNLNSMWREPSENSWSREPLVWNLFKEMGVEALAAYHVQVKPFLLSLPFARRRRLLAHNHPSYFF
jgi:nicotinamide mononucleotide adenylyltransferase